MRKRCLLSLAVTGSLLVAIFVCARIVIRISAPRIDESAYERIQDGMTLAEVEGVIGAPPGNYATEAVKVRYCIADSKAVSLDYLDVLKGADTRGWVGDDGVILIYLSESGVVKRTLFYETVTGERSLLERIWRWLRGEN